MSGDGTPGKGWPGSPQRQSTGQRRQQEERGQPGTPSLPGPLPPQWELWMKGCGKPLLLQGCTWKPLLPWVMCSGSAVRAKEEQRKLALLGQHPMISISGFNPQRHKPDWAMSAWLATHTSIITMSWAELCPALTQHLYSHYSLQHHPTFCSMWGSHHTPRPDTLPEQVLAAAVCLLELQIP